MERSLPRNESSTGANVTRNESSTKAKVFSVDFSLPGTKVQRNEKAWNHPEDSGNKYLILTKSNISCKPLLSLKLYSAGQEKNIAARLPVWNEDEEFIHSNMKLPNVTKMHLCCS